MSEPTARQDCNMRIYFESLTLPKKAAKRVKEQFTSDFIRELYPEKAMKLSDAQEITARMLGYDSWHEMCQVTKKGHPPSLLDEDVSPIDQIARIDFQTSVLQGISPLIEPAVREIALKLRVSARSNYSDSFIEDAYRRNRITKWKDPFSGKYEWRFCPSIRTVEMSETVYDIQEKWDSGRINLFQLYQELSDILSEQPENLPAMFTMIRAFVDVGEIEQLSELAFYEKNIRESLPKEYIRHNNPVLRWGEIDNRYFLRILYVFGEANYILGNYQISRSWFELVAKTNEDKSMDFSSVYLADLTSDEPSGLVHMLEDKEIQMLLSYDPDHIREVLSNM